MTNTNDITAEQVGEKFLDWLKLERKHMALREEMYYADFDDYERDNDEVYKPSDKSELMAIVRKLHDSIKEQQEAYKELLEVSDLYIAKGLLEEENANECKDCIIDCGHLYTCDKHTDNS